jgi:hypothetical protein
MEIRPVGAELIYAERLKGRADRHYEANRFFLGVSERVKNAENLFFKTIFYDGNSSFGGKVKL